MRRIEKFICNRIEHHADDWLSIFQQANRNREARITVREICSAIKRIHVPDEWRDAESSFPEPSSATMECCWKIAPQSRDDRRLRLRSVSVTKSTSPL